jgi:hypothetical protein
LQIIFPSPSGVKDNFDAYAWPLGSATKPEDHAAKNPGPTGCPCLRWPAGLLPCESKHTSRQALAIDGGVPALQEIEA